MAEAARTADAVPDLFGPDWCAEAERMCGATDGLPLVGDEPDDLDEPWGRCTLDAGHEGDWHQEWRDGRLWAEWRGPHPGQRCGICGKDGSEH